MTNTNNKRLAKRPKILYTTPVTIDQRAVKASESIWFSCSSTREREYKETNKETEMILGYRINTAYTFSPLY